MRRVFEDATSFFFRLFPGYIDNGVELGTNDVLASFTTVAARSCDAVCEDALNGTSVCTRFIMVGDKSPALPSVCRKYRSFLTRVDVLGHQHPDVGLDAHCLSKMRPVFI